MNKLRDIVFVNIPLMGGVQMATFPDVCQSFFLHSFLEFPFLSRVSPPYFVTSIDLIFLYSFYFDLGVASSFSSSPRKQKPWNMPNAFACLM